ncbi:MAG: glycosyltransferase [Candidatus Bathyarchaeia archaeon]
MRVSIIVPTKDEPNAGRLVQRIHEILSGMDHEVIIVDKSAAPQKIEGALMIRQRSKGLGRAILEGLEHASGEVIVTMDGDLSHDPRHLPQMLGKIPDYDIVVGSRFIAGGRSHDTAFRKLVSQAFRILAKLILDIGVEDPLSGFSAMRREVLQALTLNPMGYKIVTEILYKAKRKGFRATEVPIEFRKREVGKSKAGVGEGARTLALMLKLRLGLQ